MHLSDESVASEDALCEVKQVQAGKRSVGGVQSHSARNRFCLCNCWTDETKRDDFYHLSRLQDIP